MPQLKSYRNRWTMVNTDMVGRKRRTGNPSEFHPMIRDSWMIRDSIRGSLGEYYTTYKSRKGETLVNYAFILQNIRQGNAQGMGYYDHGGSQQQPRLRPRRVREQLMGAYKGTNIVLSRTFESDGETLMVRHAASQRAAWNDSYSDRNASSQDFLTTLENFEDYISEGLPGLGPGGYDYAPLLKKAEGGNSAAWYYAYWDHACTLYNLSDDLELRKAAGMELTIDPVYNYYPATTPPYEEVIGGADYATAVDSEHTPDATLGINEYLLPNVYYLQIELQNTGSELRAQYHLDALTLGQRVPWFLVSDQQTVTEANVGRYYDMYAEELNSLSTNLTQLEAADSVASLNNKDFVVLYPDLGALDEDRIDTTTIPFYNKLTLGYDVDLKTGKNEHISILRMLANGPETRGFLSMMQMEAVLRLSTEKSLASSGSFTRAARIPHNAEDASEWSYDLVTEDHPILFDVEDLLEEWDMEDRSGMLATMINSFSTLATDPQYPEMDLSQLPFRLIRDYTLSEEQLEIDPEAPENAETDMFGEQLNVRSVERVQRTLEEVFAGVPSHTETLMYVIKKKTAPNAEPIQTFYISAKFFPGVPTVLYDAQVKYNTEYFYEIDRVVLIFGNEYKYYNPSFRQFDGASRNTTTGLLESSNRAKLKYTNEPSIKAVVVPYVIGDIESIILDKPPVPPELSFYPFMGVNNKVQILLNSNTGELESRPVEILPTDGAYFAEEYRSQTGLMGVTFQDIVEGNKKITFRSDDPVDAYQLFKLDNIPESYASFASGLIEIDPLLGVGGMYKDTIEPNKKYYYCARALDLHGNLSNPSHIYQIEMVDNNGQIFFKQKVFSYEKPTNNYVKSGRRFVYVAPALQQSLFMRPDEVGNPGINNLPTSNILGAPDIDTLWQKTFRVRLTSTKTGRKVDLNLTFKNSGILNPSE